MAFHVMRKQRTLRKLPVGGSVATLAPRSAPSDFWPAPFSAPLTCSGQCRRCVRLHDAEFAVT